jgi:hypothetical protein
MFPAFCFSIMDTAGADARRRAWHLLRPGRGMGYGVLRGLTPALTLGVNRWTQPP